VQNEFETIFEKIREIINGVKNFGETLNIQNESFVIPKVFKNGTFPAY
jgi:hypothetical protein